MAKVKRIATVNYSAQQMFDLVNDVQAYPMFLPGCVAAQIQNHDTQEMVATLEIAKAGIHKTFTTRNRLTPYRCIHIQLVNGPFKHLEGTWHFVELHPDCCRIEFDLDFEFRSKLIAFAFGGIFGELMASMVQSFVRRAKEVYGERQV